MGGGFAAVGSAGIVHGVLHLPLSPLKSKQNDDFVWLFVRVAVSLQISIIKNESKEGTNTEGPFTAGS